MAPRRGSFSLPEHHGFDQNLGGDDHGAPGSFFHPFKGTWGIPTTKLRASKQAFAGGAKGDYLTDVLAEGTIKLIKENGKKKPFFLYFPFYAVHTPLQGKKEKIERYKQVPKEKRQGNPVYAAMVESVDDAVGKVMGAVRELGMEKDTLVLFTSDNGGFARATDHASAGQQRLALRGRDTRPSDYNRSRCGKEGGRPARCRPPAVIFIRPFWRWRACP